MIDDSTPQPDDENPIPPPGLSPALNRLRHSDEIQRAEQSLFDAIARKTMTEIVPTPIEGRHIWFTGNGPYRQECLQAWAEKLGAFADPDQHDLSQASWIVIGRSDYEEDRLEQSVQRADVRHFSQEQFLSLLLFGEEATARNQGGQWTVPHSRLNLIELSKLMLESDLGSESWEDFFSPSPQLDLPAAAPPNMAAAIRMLDVPGETGDAVFDRADELQRVSELAMLGYSVEKSVSVVVRHVCLVIGVRSLGLSKVIDHLLWLIRFHGRNPQRRNAVLRWNEDLAWLTSSDAELKHHLSLHS